MTAAVVKRQKTGGRKKGSLNKVTVEVKGAILQAFDNVGGAKYLTKVAEENPAVFCTLLGKVLPMDITTSDGSMSPVEIVIHRASDLT